MLQRNCYKCGLAFPGSYKRDIVPEILIDALISTRIRGEAQSKPAPTRAQKPGTDDTTSTKPAAHQRLLQSVPANPHRQTTTSTTRPAAR
jgi:hypothetical protein